ncbi:MULTISPECIES: hypothetical protein [Niastella]|uniref:Uncharacterized protein n=1 Tax=Niastella soli TaxID=2821487 RepID=A0ABS3Z3C9_9BACT|nr:hypothetical protein [Niastella soli]MBO9204650.1 hypothetical protein [Niastella soli]
MKNLRFVATAAFVFAVVGSSLAFKSTKNLYHRGSNGTCNVFVKVVDNGTTITDTQASFTSGAACTTVQYKNQ